MRLFGLSLALILGPTTLLAEQGVVFIQVKNTKNQPVSGVRLSTGGAGSVSGRTDVAGRTRIQLAPQTGGGDKVTLQIVEPSTLVFIDPWDSRVVVPSFENKSDNYVQVVLANKGDRALLENEAFFEAAVNQAFRLAALAKDQNREQKRDALEEVARTYDLPATEIDAAIRAFGRKTQDPYKKGLAALYEENYSLATSLLSESARIRETQAEKADAVAADVELYLGRSLYLEGKFRESVTALRKADKWRPDDSTIQNLLAMSLSELGDYAAAEPLYRRALEIDQGRYGLRNANVASIKTNLAFLHRGAGDYAGAKQLFQEALETDEELLGPLHPKVAIDMSNLAMLLTETEDCDGSGVLLQKVLKADEEAYAKGLVSLDSPAIAAHVNNFADMLRCKGDYPEAERNYRQALELDDKAGRHDHPSRAITLCGLASALAEQGKYEEAERRFREALAIDKNSLGPDHPRVATDADALGMMFVAQKNYGAAEEQLREALRIDEGGSNYFSQSRDLQDLARLFRAKGDTKTRLEFLTKAIKLQKERREKQASQESPPPPN